MILTQYFCLPPVGQEVNRVLVLVGIINFFLHWPCFPTSYKVLLDYWGDFFVLTQIVLSIPNISKIENFQNFKKSIFFSKISSFSNIQFFSKFLNFSKIRKFEKSSKNFRNFKVMDFLLKSTLIHKNPILRKSRAKKNIPQFMSSFSSYTLN